jgi:leucyl aminopeptidase
MPPHPRHAAILPLPQRGPLVPDHLVARADATTIPITPMLAKDLQGWLERQPSQVVRWVTGSQFEARPGAHLVLPEADGALRVLLGVEDRPDIWSWGALPMALPEGRYRIDAALNAAAADRAALGWALGGYSFIRYRKPKRRPAELVWPEAADRAAVSRAADATFLVRDLVNTPAEDMGPAELAEAAVKVARAHGAKSQVIVGDALLKRNYPTIHAVGRASSRAPRFIDLRWGGKGPRITLVGKGVCFDTGGLDLKPASGMELMKKDMGGAAHVLALAQMVMDAKLPVRLRVLIPAVENSVSGNAFRPLDIIRTRKGLTVEVGNTDAEGRLILCDALAEAMTEKPDLVIDCATLTGAARVALGPDLPAMFANDDATAEALLRHGLAEDDPVWRLPLHPGYRAMLDSKIADMNNVSSGPFAGAITAALFLEAFVDAGIPWVHLDLFAWNPRARPGRPEGGAAMALRALYALVAERAGKGGKAKTSRKRR